MNLAFIKIKVCMKREKKCENFSVCTSFSLKNKFDVSTTGNNVGCF